MTRKTKQARPAQCRSLLRSEAGSVLVIAVPLGLLMTGVVWHLVGVCDAVLLSDGLRHNADQTAFESAIWHARGMNIIAMINLVVSTLSSIFVAWIVVANAASFAGTLCGGSIPTPGCMGHTQTEAFALSDKFYAAEPMVVKWVAQQLVTLTNLQKATSAVTPVVALTRTSKTGNDLLDFTISFAGSMVPDSNLDPLLKTSGVSANFPRLTLSADTPALPVQAAQVNNFCDKVAELVPDMAETLLTRSNHSWILTAHETAKHNWRNEFFESARLMPCIGMTKGKLDVAAIWKLAEHRNDHSHEYAFQVLGFGFGKTDRVIADDEMVQVSAKGATFTVKPVWTASQAEFYFDCAGVPWSKCADTALMAPNWTARLRRVRVPELDNVQDVFNYIVIPPGYAATLPSGTVTFFTTHADKVWDRITQLIH